MSFAPVCQRFPQRWLGSDSNVRLIDNGPFSSFQGRSSGASSFHAFFCFCFVLFCLVPSLRPPPPPPPPPPPAPFSSFVVVTPSSLSSSLYHCTTCSSFLPFLPVQFTSTIAPGAIPFTIPPLYRCSRYISLLPLYPLQSSFTTDPLVVSLFPINNCSLLPPCP